MNWMPGCRLFRWSWKVWGATHHVFRLIMTSFTLDLEKNFNTTNNLPNRILHCTPHSWVLSHIAWVWQNTCKNAVEGTSTLHANQVGFDYENLVFWPHICDCQTLPYMQDYCCDCSNCDRVQPSTTHYTPQIYTIQFFSNTALNAKWQLLKYYREQMI